MRQVMVLAAGAAALMAGAAVAAAPAGASPTPSLPPPDPQEPLPDRLCIDERSPFFGPPELTNRIGVRFKGVERDNVVEYCVSEGWVRLGVRDYRGRMSKYGDGNWRATPRTQGLVEPYWKVPK
jgi:hypothetical protein